MEPIITVLGIGAFGGAVRSFLGYETQSDAEETFNKSKAIKSMVRAAIVGATVVMGATALTGSEITNATYVMAFFTAVGSDVITKEGTSTTKKYIHQ